MSQTPNRVDHEHNAALAELQSLAAAGETITSRLLANLDPDALPPLARGTKPAHWSHAAWPARQETTDAR